MADYFLKNPNFIKYIIEGLSKKETRNDTIKFLKFLDIKPNQLIPVLKIVKNNLEHIPGFGKQNSIKFCKEIDNICAEKLSLYLNKNVNELVFYLNSFCRIPKSKEPQVTRDYIFKLSDKLKRTPISKLETPVNEILNCIMNLENDKVVLLDSIRDVESKLKIPVKSKHVSKWHKEKGSEVNRSSSFEKLLDYLRRLYTYEQEQRVYPKR